MNRPRVELKSVFLVAFLALSVLPVYWMVNMSFKTNEEILGLFSLWPRNFTFDNFRVIFTDVSWYSGYINSMIYVALNTAISLAVALPAAYAFSRYRFLGDKHVFFWLLTNRMTPPAIFLIAYLVLSVLPVYWMVNMSFKTNEEILGVFSMWPRNFTLDNFRVIFTDVSWYSGYINSMIYVALNTAISLAVALPAAYAFSRYRFLGDKQVFFWLLTNRMTPPAIFLLPFFQLYSTLGMMDTHIAVALAHLVFNVPLAVWILEGFMSGIPREIDETAYIDGYSFPRFFVTIFIPLIKAGIGVTAFFCFMFSWVELLMARTLTSVNAKPIVAVMTRTVSAAGMDWGVLAAAGVLTILPGAVVIWFVRHYIAKGFAMGRV